MTDQPMSLIEELENPPRLQDGRLDEGRVIDLMRTAAQAYSTMIGVAAKAAQGIRGVAQRQPEPSLEKELRRVLEVMKSANAKPPERSMSIWDIDVKAVEEAADFLSALSSTDREGK